MANGWGSLASPRMVMLKTLPPAIVVLVACQQAPIEKSGKSVNSSCAQFSSTAPTGTPRGTQAIAVLQHPLMSRPIGNYEYDVTWLRGDSSRVPSSRLLGLAEGVPPVLHPLRLPAVFDADAKSALVWGEHGWGCVRRHFGTEDVLVTLDSILDGAADAVRHQHLTQTNRDGYTFHDRLAVSIQGQVRLEPSSESSLAMRQMPDSWSCRDILEDLPGFAPTNPPSIARLSTPRPFERTCFAPVMIARRSGEWAQVVLPEVDTPIFRADRFLVVRWEERPAGWMRVKGGDSSKGPLWRIHQWEKLL